MSAAGAPRGFWSAPPRSAQLAAQPSPLEQLDYHAVTPPALAEVKQASGGYARCDYNTKRSRGNLAGNDGVQGDQVEHNCGRYRCRETKG